MGFTNNSMDQESGRDTCLGFLMPEWTLSNPRTGVAPLTASPTVTVAAILPTATQTFTILAQPDVPRVTTMTLTDANSSIQQISAVVRGLDWWYNPISERITLTNSGTATATGTLAFRQIDSITAVCTGTIGGGDTVSFGTGTALGLPVRIREVGDIKFKRVDATQDTSGVIYINADGSATWVGASVPDSARQFRITIASRFNVVG